MTFPAFAALISESSTLRRFGTPISDLRNLRPDCFIYEDVLTQPDRFVGAGARHLDVETTHDLVTDFEVQRDSITDEWLDRFQADVSQKGFSFQSERPARTVKNLVRFLRKMPMKI